VVHFPIALVTVAAILESWQIVRRKPGLAAATPVCVALGALSAIAATVFGFFLDQEHRGGSPFAFPSQWTTTDIHKWAGVGASVLALLGALLLFKAATPKSGDAPGAILTLRLLVLLGAAAVGATGYLGGDLVFGQNHLFKGIFDKKPPKPDTPDKGPPSTEDKTGQLAGGPVDFVRDVKPIFQEACFRCHGGDKVKGKFNMKTRAGVVLFKGGASGEVTVTPGQPEKSSVYTLLVEKDPDSRMPPPKEEKQLTAAQIETVKKWIAEGASWPDGVELQ
jgi:uncharacterized membrane protein